MKYNHLHGTVIQISLVTLPSESGLFTGTKFGEITPSENRARFHGGKKKKKNNRYYHRWVKENP